MRGMTVPMKIHLNNQTYQISKAVSFPFLLIFTGKYRQEKNVLDLFFKAKKYRKLIFFFMSQDAVIQDF